MLAKVYRELMILGFISFGVVLCNVRATRLLGIYVLRTISLTPAAWAQEFDLIHNHNAFISFEFAHLLIFGVSMIYVLTTVVQTKRLNYTNDQWKRIANVDPNRLVEDLEATCKKMQEKSPKPSFAPLWLSMMAPGVDMWEDCEWKIMRLIFLKEFDLGTEFDYSKYVKIKLTTKLSHSLHVHPSTWGLVCIFAAIIWIGGTVTRDDDSAHRRLAAAADEFSCDCWHEGGDEFDSLQHLTFNESGMIQNCTIEVARKGITKAGATLGVIFPAILGWFLFGMQGFVLYKTKAALHNVLRLKGCNSAQDLPLFLRSLDAQVEMRQQLPHIPMFGNAGDDFVDDVMDCLELTFYNHGDTIFNEGDVGSSMFFICKGFVDVVLQSSGDKVIGSLSPGDYFGEMAILLDQPRTAAMVARTKCAIFQLDRDSLTELGKDFPKAVGRMLDFAESRRQAALAGKWDKQQSLRKEDEDMVAEHSNRMKELQRTQQAKKDEHEKQFPEELSIQSLGKGGKKAVKNIAKGAAGAAASALTSSPIQTAVKVTKKTAAAAGLPGMGVMKPHSSGHHHAHSDRMEGAEEIMPHSRTHLFEELSEVSLLFNCFTWGYYFLHIMPVVIAGNFGQGDVGLLEDECNVLDGRTWDPREPINYQCVSDDGTVQGTLLTTLVRLGANAMIMLPAVLLMVFLAPISTKYSCLLDNVLYKDEDTIAEVYHHMTRLISLKNAIKKQLTKVGLSLAHDKGILDASMSINEIAPLIFKELDYDDDGSLTYAELRSGLTNFGVYLTKKEFRSMMEFVDPDFDKKVDIDEWVQFLACTDEQLASNEWLLHKQSQQMQKRFSSELTRKMMELSKCVPFIRSQLST